MSINKRKSDTVYILPIKRIIKNKSIDEKVIEDALNFKPRWKADICYSRKNTKQTKVKSLNDLESKLPDWTNENEICIDGMSGCGKTTMMNKMNRLYCKIKSTGLSKSSHYNIKPFHSLEYLFYQPMTICKNVGWDRSPYSNLIFYVVHYIMAHYKENPTKEYRKHELGECSSNTEFVFKKTPLKTAVPPPCCHQEVAMLLNNFYESNSILDIFKFVEDLKKTNILILVSSDINLVQYSMMNREDLESATMTVCENDDYLNAQYHAYMHFATIMKCPIIDIAEYLKYNLAISDVQYLIMKKVDVSDANSSFIVPPFEEMSDIVHMAANYDYTLMYINSTK